MRSHIFFSLFIGLIFQTPGFGAALLTFDTNVSGTLTDKNGIGSGFTHRLPGTGGSIPTNDPNTEVITSSGRLLFQSTRSDFSTSGFGRNLSVMDAPALLLAGIQGSDFQIEAVFLNLHADDLSDQMGLFIGTSADNVVRVGIHQGVASGKYASFLISSNSGFDGPISLGIQDLFSAGQDGLFQFGRINGLWYYRWQNLSDPTKDGSFENIDIPQLASETDLYVGIFNNDARNTTPQTATVEYFSVQVPEPNASLITATGLAGWLARRRRVRFQEN